MADEPTNPAIEEEVIEDQPQPDVEETPTENPDVEETVEQTEPEETESEEEEPSEEQPPSRREQLRIQNLLAKYGDPDKRQEPKAPSNSREDRLDYTSLEANPELIKELEADRQREGETQFNEGLKRAEFFEWRTSLKIDAPIVEKKYPILDPSSPEFHPAVANAVNSWYLQMSGFDPERNTVANTKAGYAEFVDGYMELVQETAGQKNAQTVKNVAKQAATTGIRPDGSSAKRLNLNRAPQEMSMEELYAAIGQKPPK